MKLRVDLTEEELRAVLSLVAARVSLTGEERTPLERAERELDLVMLQYEQRVRDGEEAI